MPKQLFWLIQGYDGTNRFFEKKVATGQITDDQMRQLLKAMTAKASLSYNEIIGAYARRRTKAHNGLLDIHRDRDRATLMCGTNPHFTARVVDGTGKPIVHPTI